MPRDGSDYHFVQVFTIDKGSITQSFYRFPEIYVIAGFTLISIPFIFLLARERKIIKRIPTSEDYPVYVSPEY